MSQGFSLKDQLFNAEKVAYLGGLFEPVSGFDNAAFQSNVMSRLLELELKQRIDWIAECLATAIPGDLAAVGPAIRTALPPPLDPTLTDDDFGDFIFAPLGEWVVAKGLDTPDLALDLIEEITQRFSMEWPIRPLLNHHPELTLIRMATWAEHPNYHVRRLVSEGTRPRLPWGQSVSLDVKTPLVLLDQLHADPTRYVTRSVANHLNDITKQDPDLVMDRLDIWRDDARQTDKELDWITAHALRGLIKAGHPRAMAMLGYDPKAKVHVTLTLPDQARINDVLELNVQINAAPGTPVLVDYAIDFLRPSGKVGRKVFKLKQAKVANADLSLTKRHRLKGGASTFTLVPGSHRVQVMVNGLVRAEGVFDLHAETPESK